ncbi:MAG: DUF1272 domain-containing protein [Crocinitomicaceae bacterium]|nr:DUF1272 domain-containing protein [Crocinitomicaceae bacterium]
MLKIKSHCERCNAHLPNKSKDAMICSFECTFCKNCVEGDLNQVDVLHQSGQ